MRKILIFFLLSTFLVLAGCVSQESSGDKGEYFVGMLIPGHIDDGGFMEAGYNGLVKIKEDLGLKTTYIDQVKPEQPLMEEALRKIATESPDMIISHGGQCSKAAAAVAKEYPDIKFVVVQGNVTGKNLSSYVVLQEESAWLAGAAAGLITETDVVGHISGIRVPPGLKGRAAFSHGLEYTNPEAEFLTTFCGDQDDKALAKEVAESEIEEGADIIFTMLNAGRQGAIDACKENGVYQIGNVRDWYEVEPEVFVASAIANVSMAGYNAANDMVNDEWKAEKVVEIGLEDPNAARLALAPYVSDSVKEKIDELTEKIVEGDIEVSTEYNGSEFEWK